MGAALSAAARQLYEISEGALVMPTIQFYNNGSCTACGSAGNNCDLCMVNLPGSGMCCVQFPSGPDEDGLPNPHSALHIYDGYFYSPTGITHELAHLFYSRGDLNPANTALGDEYETGTWFSQCGHSLMAYSPREACMEYNHALDFDPLTTGDSEDSVWTIYAGNGLTPWQPVWGMSPDTAPLSSYVMDYKVGYVIQM